MMTKQFKTLLIAAVAFFGVNQAAVAQAKTAHVDVQALMSKMPALLEARKQLEKLGSTYEAEVKTMVDEWQSKVRKYEQEGASVTDEVNLERSREVQEMEKRIVDYRDNAQKELQKKEMDLTKPIIDKVRASIQKIGKAKGYQYVLNSEQLLMADGPDITADVQKDLGF